MDSFEKYYGALTAAFEELPRNFGALGSVVSELCSADQIVCVGIGKSGYIAQKMAASLLSISEKAIFLHPSEAIHGDLGAVEPNAAVIIFSKSGNSSEINIILPLLIKRGASIVAICARVQSPLGRSAKHFIRIHAIHEGDDLNIMPLISTDMSLIIANMIVAAIASCRGVEMERFVENHPGGQLGRNVSKQLCDLPEWKARAPFVGEGVSLIEAITTESQYKAGLICVLDNSKKLIGVVSDGDIRRAIKESDNIRATKVIDIVNRNPILLFPEMLVGEAIEAMEDGKRKVFSAPVLDKSDRCIGVVVLHDLL